MHPNLVNNNLPYSLSQANNEYAFYNKFAIGGHLYHKLDDIVSLMYLNIHYKSFE